MLYYDVLQSALPVITIMALWQLLNLGTGCTVTHCGGRIALWSHQNAQTASRERCIVQIVNVPQGDSPPNPRECANCTGSEQDLLQCALPVMLCYKIRKWSVSNEANLSLKLPGTECDLSPPPHTHTHKLDYRGLLIWSSNWAAAILTNGWLR